MLAQPSLFQSNHSQTGLVTHINTTESESQLSGGNWAENTRSVQLELERPIKAPDLEYL